MTEDDLRAEVAELRDRIEVLEHEQEKLARLPDAVAELKGMVATLSSMITNRFDTVDQSVDKAAGIKTAITFMSVVMVPILVALIGGYFALRAGVAGK